MKKKLIKNILPLLGGIGLTGIAIMLALIMSSCGTVKKSAAASIAATAVENATVTRNTQTDETTTEASRETATREETTERITSVTETTTTTELSMPDSTGIQHKVRETVVVKQTDETERRGATAIATKDTDISTETGIIDSLHSEIARAESMAATSSEEKRRKGGIGGYLLTAALGVIVAAAGWWALKKYVLR